jgi:hypothetical protein
VPSYRHARIGIVAALLAAASAAGAACGGDADPGAEEQVAAALREVRASFAAGDVGGVCARTSGVASCDRTVRFLVDRAKRRGRGATAPGGLVDVRLAGGRATAIVGLKPRIPGAVRFVEEDGAWKLADLRVRPLLARSRWRAASGQIEAIQIAQTRGGRRVVCSPWVFDKGAREPARDSGCTFRVASAGAPVTMLTAFGALEVARCRAGYSLAGDGLAGISVDRVGFAGPGLCAEIAHCRHGETGLTYPWQGSKAEGPYRPIHFAIDICVNTPLGRVRGMSHWRLTRRGRDWAIAPYDYPVGESSIQLGGLWDLRPDDLRIRPRGF